MLILIGTHLIPTELIHQGELMKSDRFSEPCLGLRMSPDKETDVMLTAEETEVFLAHCLEHGIILKLTAAPSSNPVPSLPAMAFAKETAPDPMDRTTHADFWKPNPVGSVLE